MTVKQDLQKALASAEAALGNYDTFAQSTQDQSAKQMFQQMSQDMRRHCQMLRDRLDYLEETTQ